jgi:hypothetical protein
LVAFLTEVLSGDAHGDDDHADEEVAAHGDDDHAEEEVSSGSGTTDCDFSHAPEHGSVGDCTAYIAAGGSCTPVRCPPLHDEFYL